MLYLYEKNTIDFTNNGEPIHHSYDEHVIRKDGFYLSFKLLLDKNEEYKTIKKEMIISAETPDGRNQFRVYDVIKRSPYVEVIALQLMYDFDNKQVNPISVKNFTGTQMINAFSSAFKSPLGQFTMDSSVTERHDFSTNEEDDDTPSHNALEILNRIIKRWDSELMLNGFDIRMIKRLGAKTDALLYEKKNISEFEDESSVRGMATRIHATSRFTPEGSDTETVISVTVDSPLINEYAQVYEKSFTNNDVRTRQELINWVNLKYSTENVDKPSRSITVATNIIDGTEINYGDDLVLKYLVHDVDEIIRCVGYDYDPIKKTYYNVTLGDWKDSFATTLTGGIVDTTNRQINQLKQNITYISMSANGKNRTAYGPEPVPNPINGDIWYYYELNRPNEVELRIFQDGFWEPIDFATKTEVEAALSEAEAAKQTAENAYNDAVTEAERLVADQSEKFTTDLNAQKTALQTEIATGYENAIGEANTVVLEMRDTITGEINIRDTTLRDEISQAEANAIAGTEQLLEEQDLIYQELFDGYDESVKVLTGSVSDASEKANQALETAGASSNLAQTAKETSERAEINAGAAQGNAQEAVGKANNAIDSVNNFTPIVAEATIKANDAISKANLIPATVSGIITDKGLVSGDWVNTRIDNVTGEINYDLSSVKGDVPNVVMGVEWTRIADPTLTRTDYVEDYVNLKDYNLKTADFNLSVEGIKTNITVIQQGKLDNSTFTSFKNNEYTNDVNGIRQRLTSAETSKLDSATFTSFKTSDYDVTVNGLKGRISSVETSKLNANDFTSFKTNEYQTTVNGINGQIVAINRDKLNATAFETFKSNDYQVTVDGFNGSINTINRDKLNTTDFNTFKSNDYQVTVNGINGSITAINRDKMNTSAFNTFKSNEYDVTVAGIKGSIVDLKTDKLDAGDFTDFKSNEYQVTMDGFKTELTSVSGAIPDYIFGVEWDRSEDPSMTRTDDAEEATSKKEFEVFLGDYNFSASGWNATNTYVTNNKTQINSLISNASGWQNTITYVNNNQTKINETISQVDSYKQTIGSNGEKITQLVMTDSAFITKVGELEGLTEDFVVGVEWDKSSSPEMARTGHMDDWTETQVAQLSDSWVLSIKSGGDIKTQINATTDGIRLESKLTHLAGNSLIDSATIKSAHIDTLNVSKLIGTVAEFTTLRSKVITVDSITSEMIKTDAATINKLFATDATITTLTAKSAFITAIKTTSLEAVNANIGNLRTSILTADVITSTHLKVDSAMVTKLMVSNLLVNALVADAIITNAMKTNTLTAITANITTIRSQVLVADVITSTHLKSDTALINKLFATTALINELTSKAAFISSIKAIDISADRVTAGTLNAANVNIINLNVANIVGLNSTFVQTNWNSSTGGSVQSTGNGLTATRVSDGTQTRLSSGVVEFWNSANNKTGEIGVGYNVYDNAVTGVAVNLEYGKEFSVRRKVAYNSTTFSEAFGINWNESQFSVRMNMSLHNNDLLAVGRVELTRGLGMGNTRISQVPGIDFHSGVNVTGVLHSINNSNIGLFSSGYLALGVGNNIAGTSELLRIASDTITAYTSLDMATNGMSRVRQISFFNSTARTGNIVNVTGTNDIGLYGSGSLYLGVNGSDNYASNIRIQRELVQFFVNIDMNGKSVTGTSDRRLKTNIVATGVTSLNIYRQLNFVDFIWKDINRGAGQQFGLIAQDAPFIGFEGADGIWRIDSSKQTMLNSLGIKELDEKITRIDTFVSQHELEIQQLKHKISELERKIA